MSYKNGTSYPYCWKSFSQNPGSLEWGLNIAEVAGFTLAVAGSVLTAGICCWEIVKKFYCPTKSSEYSIINDDGANDGQTPKCCGKN